MQVGLALPRGLEPVTFRSADPFKISNVPELSLRSASGLSWFCIRMGDLGYMHLTIAVVVIRQWCEFSVQVTFKLIFGNLLHVSCVHHDPWVLVSPAAVKSCLRVAASFCICALDLCDDQMSWPLCGRWPV